MGEEGTGGTAQKGTEKRTQKSLPDKSLSCIFGAISVRFLGLLSAMPKKRSSDLEAEPAPKKLSTYTVKLDDTQMARLRGILASRGWAPFEVEHSRFAFRGPDCNVTAYSSGKVVIAGKGTEEFVTMTLEPQVFLLCTRYEIICICLRESVQILIHTPHKFAEVVSPLILGCVQMRNTTLSVMCQRGRHGLDMGHVPDASDGLDTCRL